MASNNEGLNSMANEIAKKGVKKVEKKVDKKIDKKASVKRNIVEKVVKYFREVYGELKRVSWPTKKELVSYTLAVVVFVVLMSVIVGLLDFVFANGIKLIVR